MSGSRDRYGSDVLTAGWRTRRRPAPAEVAAERGLVVEDAETGWCGAVVRVEKAGGMHVVRLEDRHGRTRGFPLGSGFLVDGEPIVLTPPRRASTAALAAAREKESRTRSGSTALTGHRATVAVASRLFVEGRHDAELVEKVWGDDLRVEGVVVEMLDGVNDLPATIGSFAPGPGRRMGVLVDHLIPGTKESRIVDAVRALPGARRYVRVLGHPYVDVWQSVRPARLGLDAWPEVPHGRDWKHGICEALGWPHDKQADIALAWKRILRQVRTYADLEPSLLASVEELLDFVTAPETP
jgi:DUF3097, C-terminal domain/DUF3097, N-terminal domain